ncbi:ATP-dependent zinc metalloprotease FtsH [candidate division WWE3 bacterium]|uniref:ATP-dependent zinc metalloprotease FtsH n=1 Tax=candidate division WWE3 bacterium TaxID=2053526 RepID=A0A955LK62_UNCKA|nr:ATP-dependent zinc metalloprotease FtsH [candidate division WWE3 bacterium]
MNLSNKQKPAQNNWLRLLRTFAIYLIVTVVIVYGVGLLLGGNTEGFFGSDVQEVPLSRVVELVNNKQVESITVEDGSLTVKTKEGASLTSQKEDTGSMYEVLAQAGVSDDAIRMVSIEVKKPLFSGVLGLLLGSLLPMLVVVAFFFIIFRQAGKNAGGVFDFGKITARGPEQGKKNIGFKDAAGVDEAIKELEEVVDFLRNPEKYRRLGARIPKGVLLIGPAGTGKTLLAQAVANEAKVPFYSMAGSEFMEMLVGVGASRVRDLFKQAKEHAPALIFIDEVESIGRQRGKNVMSSHGEQEQTLNQILVEMDGFNPNDNVIVVAATNRPDLLDPALTRPGRFDRRVVLQLPDIKGREDIIHIHSRNKPIAKDVDLSKVAKMTVGFSGAEIENMLNESAILAAANGKNEISGYEIKESITKVKLGRERRHIQSDEDKRITAYHEAGHAIVANSIPKMDPVQRVSIVSRGLALGFTEINPEMDRSHQTRTDIMNKITALLGGRAAEELIFNDRTVGAGSDLEQASSLAFRMVNEFGMSDLGPTAFVYKNTQDAYDSILGTTHYSEATLAKIDEQVRQIIDHCYKIASDILLNRRDVLDRVVEALLKEETIEQEEFEQIVKAS